MIKIAQDVVKGRAVFAQQSFKPGEEVMSCTAYAAVLNNKDLDKRCDYSFQPATSLLVCGGCKVACFASEAAQTSSWVSGYGHTTNECKALCSQVPSPLIRLCARILWKEDFKDQDLMISLVDHWDEMDDQQSEQFMELALLVKQYMPQSDQDFRLVDIARLLAQISCNAIAICDEQLVVYGLGLYPLAAAINHCSNPNCIQQFTANHKQTDGGTPLLSIRCIRDIAKGDEITISYIDLISLRREQREWLQQTYYFDIDKGMPRTPTISISKCYQHNGISCVVKVYNEGCENYTNKRDEDLGAVHIDDQKFFTVVLEERNSTDELVLILEIWDSEGVLLDQQKISRVSSWFCDIYLNWKEGKQLYDDGRIEESISKLEVTMSKFISRGERGRINFALGSMNIIRLRLLDLYMQALLQEGSQWDKALQCCRNLQRMYACFCSQALQNVALNYVALAKLEMIAGEDTSAQLAIKNALQILQTTAPDSNLVNELLLLRYQLENACN